MNAPDLTMDKVLSAQHAEWLSHPVTQQMIRGLKDLRDKHVTHIGLQSSRTDAPESLFRAYGMSIQTINTILTFVNSTTEFVERSKQTHK